MVTNKYQYVLFSTTIYVLFTVTAMLSMIYILGVRSLYHSLKYIQVSYIDKAAFNDQISSKLILT